MLKMDILHKTKARNDLGHSRKLSPATVYGIPGFNSSQSSTRLPLVIRSNTIFIINVSSNLLTQVTLPAVCNYAVFHKAMTFIFSITQSIMNRF